METILNKLHNINILPNPVENLLTVNTSLKNASYFIFNSNGQLVDKGYSQEKCFVVFTEAYKKGIYLLSIVSKNRTSEATRFVKN